MDALLLLATAQQLTKSILAEAERQHNQQWLWYQRTLISQRARKLTETWLQESEETQSPIRLEGRPIAKVLKNGYVEGTSLHYRQAEQQTYDNILFAFVLRRQDDEMVISMALPHRLAKTATEQSSP